MYRLHIRETLTALCALLILVGVLAISNKSILGLRVQNQRKVIANEGVTRTDQDPLIITNIKVGPKDVDLNQEFDADDEWLKEVSFKVKNHSKKNVTYVGVDLFFPDTTSAGPGMMKQLRFGQRPGHPNPADRTLLLKPGDAIDISIPSRYGSLKKFLEIKQPVTSIRKMMVRVYLVFFEDGTKWDLGNYYTPDQNRPTGFRMIDPPPGIISND